MFDVIERLKSEWTDKYVVIDSVAPELARFARSTGQVKTVNMNGRCLVEFDQYNNTAWYDVDPSCLKVVPKPLPRPVEPTEKAAKPAETSTSAAGGKLSTAEILARARAAKASAAPPAAEEPAAPAEPEPEAAPVAPKAAAPKPAAGGLPKATADIIAWCRDHDAKG